VLAIAAPRGYRIGAGEGEGERAGFGDAAAPLGREAAEVGEKALIVPVRETLSVELVEERLRKLESFLTKDPAIVWVIFEIDFESDDLQSDDFEAAQRLGDYILDGEPLRGKTTVAFIPAGKKAFGAAVLPVIACREIALGVDARFGAGDTPNPLVDKETREKYRRVAERYARERNRAQLLAGLMVAKAPEKIYKLQRKGDNPEPSKRWDFWTQNELNAHDLAERMREFLPPEEFLDKGGYLTLDQRSAHDYGWARYRGIEDDPRQYAGLRDALGLKGGHQAIIHIDSGPLAPGSASGQTLVDLLNSPLARFLLIVGGFLGIFLEIKMLGTLLPGLFGLACFTVFFAAAMFPTSGTVEPTASWFEAVLFVIGLGLVAAEFLLLPGVAVFGLAGCLLSCVSLILAMVPSDTGAAGAHTSFRDAVATLAAGFGASGLCFLVLLQFLPRARWLSGGLVTLASIQGVPSADSAVESQTELGWMIGKTGTAQTPLRPAGKVLLENGKLLDVVADGGFIERGEKVVVRACTSTRIVVSRGE
jgi:hypothetical protein